MTNEIGMRWAESDMVALFIAQGVEKAGGSVFSISYRGLAKYTTAIDPHARYIVWFKIPEGVSFAEIDASIDKEMEIYDRKK